MFAPSQPLRHGSRFYGSRRDEADRFRALQQQQQQQQRKKLLSAGPGAGEEASTAAVESGPTQQQYLGPPPFHSVGRLMHEGERAKVRTGRRKKRSAASSRSRRRTLTPVEPLNPLGSVRLMHKPLPSVLMPPPPPPRSSMMAAAPQQGLVLHSNLFRAARPSAKAVLTPLSRQPPFPAEPLSAPAALGGGSGEGQAHPDEDETLWEDSGGARRFAWMLPRGEEQKGPDSSISSSSAGNINQTNNNPLPSFEDDSLVSDSVTRAKAATSGVGSEGEVAALAGTSVPRSRDGEGEARGSTPPLLPLPAVPASPRRSCGSPARFSPRPDPTTPPPIFRLSTSPAPNGGSPDGSQQAGPSIDAHLILHSLYHNGTEAKRQYLNMYASQVRVEYSEEGLSNTLKRQRRCLPPLEACLPSRVLHAGSSMTSIGSSVSPTARGDQSSYPPLSPGNRGSSRSPSAGYGGGDIPLPPMTEKEAKTYHVMQELLATKRTTTVQRKPNTLHKHVYTWTHAELAKEASQDAERKRLLKKALCLRDAAGAPTWQLAKYQEIVSYEQICRLAIEKEEDRAFERDFWERLLEQELQRALGWE